VKALIVCRSDGESERSYIGIIIIIIIIIINAMKFHIHLFIGFLKDKEEFKENFFDEKMVKFMKNRTDKVRDQMKLLESKERYFFLYQ